MGGEEIRVYNDLDYTHDSLNGQFNAFDFLIKGNKIGYNTTNKMAIINTKNGIKKCNENFDLSGSKMIDRKKDINAQNTSNIDWGNL